MNFYLKKKEKKKKPDAIPQFVPANLLCLPVAKSQAPSLFNIQENVSNEEGWPPYPYGTLDVTSKRWSAQVVQTAAPMGKGLKELEEALLFQAELMELKASCTRPMVGVVVEAKMLKGQGPVATVIIKRGTLKVEFHSDSSLISPFFPWT